MQFAQWCQQYHSPRAAHSFEQGRGPLIMGIVNVTPDSFSDGGECVTPELAVNRALTLLEEGADILDVGGESSRPFRQAVSCDEELARVIPVIEKIRAHSEVCISIDTHKPRVMQEAVQAGASMINDIQALQSEGALAAATALKVPICLMHMQGTPESMQDNPQYATDVVDEIHTFFQQRAKQCLQHGIASERLILDPGIGFGKSLQHNLQVLKRLREFTRHKRPLLVGVSRKSMLGEILKKPISERLIGGIAAAVFAVLQGVSIIRTHDVSETKQAYHVLESIFS